MPHLQTLVNFIANTLPKPVLFALLYRLLVLHFASQILPTIGADSWEGVDDGWDSRPVSINLHYNFVSSWTILTNLDPRHLDWHASSSHIVNQYSLWFIRIYFVSILDSMPQDWTNILGFTSVLDPASQIWWRWMNIFCTLVLWAVELRVSSDEDNITKDWKVEWYQVGLLTNVLICTF